MQFPCQCRWAFPSAVSAKRAEPVGANSAPWGAGFAPHVGPRVVVSAAVNPAPAARTVHATSREARTRRAPPLHFRRGHRRADPRRLPCSRPAHRLPLVAASSAPGARQRRRPSASPNPRTATPCRALARSPLAQHGDAWARRGRWSTSMPPPAPAGCALPEGGEILQVPGDPMDLNKWWIRGASSAVSRQPVRSPSVRPTTDSGTGRSGRRSQAPARSAPPPRPSRSTKRRATAAPPAPVGRPPCRWSTWS